MINRYKNIETNLFHPKSQTNVSYVDWYFDELMIYILIIKEEQNIGFNKKLDLAKEIKKYTEFGLFYIKNFINLLLEFDLINNNFEISDLTYQLNGLKDVHYIINNNLTVNQYLRNKKIKHIIYKYENK